MTRDKTIKLAREADMGFDFTAPGLMAELERFAALVAAAEREACAKVCETLRSNWNYCAAAIRARGPI